MQGGSSRAQLSAIKEASAFRDIPDEVVSAAAALSQATRNPDVRDASIGLVLLKQDRRPAYSPEEVGKVRKLSELKITNESILAAGRNSRLQFTTTLGANGANIIVLEPAVAR
jgi:hypothetical protein